MSKTTRFGFLVTVALALPFTLAAQHAAAPSGSAGAAHSSVGTMAAHPHHIVSRSAGTTRQLNANRGTTTSSANPDSNVVTLSPESLASLQDLTGQVPGLGFDYEHLVAISGNLAEKALIDPATQAELALLARLNRGLSAPAYFLWDYGYGDAVPASYDNSDPAPQPAPQVIIVQQPAAAPAAQSYSQPDTGAEQQAAPLPDASDFLLVLKDGVTVSAVAFTRKGDQLIYVTKEGNRRTMSMDSIDADATSKINAARGTPLKLEL
jgi:hypothetical protein